MRRLGLLSLAVLGLAFPAGLGLAVYVASGSTLVSPAATARVPTGTIGRPSTPPTTTTVETGATTDLRGPCDEVEHREDPECAGRPTTTAETTTGGTTTEDGVTTSDDDDSSGSSGSGSDRSGSNSGRSGGDNSGSGGSGSGSDDD